MRRRKNNLFAKVGVLCLALVLGMGGMGVGLAMWSEGLYITGTIGTGEWVECETGYAYGDSYAHCFSEYGFSNWGWTNGALSPDEEEYVFDIYAGAGQCDIDKGTLVGTLTVDYDGTTVTVTYDMYEGYTMDETHLYVGTEPLPGGDYTTAPGQYPYNHNLEDATTDTYELEDFSGPIYVVAHAVVCWFDPSPS